MNREQIIEILKEVATHAITSELNPNELDDEGFEIFADRLERQPISEKRIKEVWERFRKYHEFLHGKSGAFTVCADRAAEIILKELNNE